MKHAILAFLCVFIVFVSGCYFENPQKTDDSGKDIDSIRIISIGSWLKCAEGTNCLEDTASDIGIIDNHEKFASACSLAGLTGANVPDIDFNEEVVIKAFMGIQKHSGFSVKFYGIDDSLGDVYIYIQFISPGKGCSENLALTYPYALGA